MSSYPSSTTVAFHCSCRTVYGITDLTGYLCPDCSAPLVRGEIVEASSEPVVNPEPESKPVTPPKNAPRSQQHGSPDAPIRELLYRAGLRGSGLAVALALYDHRAPGSWSANISQTKLAESVGRSVRTIIRTLGQLRNRGVILGLRKRRKRGGGHFLEYGLRPFLPEAGRSGERPKMADLTASARSARSKAPTVADILALAGLDITGLKAGAVEIKTAGTGTGSPLNRAQTAQGCVECSGTGWKFETDRLGRSGVRRCGCRTRSQADRPRQAEGTQATGPLASRDPLTDA